MEHTLIVWEEIPECTKFYAIPNHILQSNEEWSNLLDKAHGHFVNSVGWESNEGLHFLNAVMVDKEDKDDLSFFDASCMKKEWMAAFSSYKIDSENPIIGFKFTKVILSGFIL